MKNSQDKEAKAKKLNIVLVSMIVIALIISAVVFFRHQQSDMTPSRNDSKTISAQQLRHQHLQIRFSGFNGFGRVVLSGDHLTEDGKVEVKRNGRLKNGDRLKISLPKATRQRFRQRGLYLQGKTHFTIKVSGLTNPNELKNTVEMQRMIDQRVQAKYLGTEEQLVFKNLWLTDDRLELDDLTGRSLSNSKAAIIFENMQKKQPETLIEIDDQDDEDTDDDLQLLAVYQLVNSSTSTKQLLVAGVDDVGINERVLQLDDDDSDELNLVTLTQADAQVYAKLKKQLQKFGVILK